MAEGIEKVFAALAGSQKAAHNMEATTAPGVTDDASKGYSADSVWFKKNSDDWYTCTDATAGAAVWVALERGGGDVTDGLVAEWFGPDSTYTAGTGSWVASNDETLILSQGTAGQRPTLNGKVLEFSNGDNLDANAAAYALLDGLDDCTIIAVATATAAGVFNDAMLFGMYSSSVSQQSILIDGSDSVIASDRRNSSTAQASISVSFSGTFLASCRAARGAAARASYGSTLQSGTAAQDAAIANGTSATMQSTGQAFDIHCIRIYNRALTDEEIVAVRAFLSDNADYGTTGDTL